MIEKLVVTGASGLLGRAVLADLRKCGKFIVQGWANSRTGADLKRVDLCDRQAVEAAIDTFQPDAIIHCAAIRAPDVVESKEALTYNINVGSSKHLAELAAARNICLIYISTDYVFDGLNPPYEETAKPNPLNKYGQQKLDGERAVLEACPNAIVLRVALLYGRVEFLGEGAVDVILKAIFDPRVECRMSDHEQRFPTHVEDVAAAIRLLLEQRSEKSGDVVRGIYHWSGDEQMTKYGMAQIMSRVFNLPITHLIPFVETEPSTKRPYNSQLSCRRLVELGAKNKYRFDVGIKSALEQWLLK